MCAWSYFLEINFGKNEVEKGIPTPTPTHQSLGSSSLPKLWLFLALIEKKQKVTIVLLWVPFWLYQPVGDRKNHWLAVEGKGQNSTAREP